MRFPLCPTCGSSHDLTTLPSGSAAGSSCFGWPASTRTPGPLPPEGDDGGTRMKMERRWVAWMAALGMAALLLATPRQGTAGPYMMPAEPPGPLLGDPDMPGGAPQGRAFLMTIPLLKGRVSLAWFGGSTVPVVILRPAADRGRVSAVHRSTK